MRNVALQYKIEVQESHLAMAHTAYRFMVGERMDSMLRESVLNAGKISESEWEQIEDRVAFIHDQLDPEDAWDRFQEIAEYEDDEDMEQWEAWGETLPQLAEKHSPREAFAMWNEKLDPEKRWQKLDEINDPVEADLYGQPESK